MLASSATMAITTMSSISVKPLRAGPRITAPRYFASVERAKLNSLRTSLVVMRDALDKFAADRGRYPDSLEQLVQERYLRQIPEDPITGSSQTWVVQPPPTNADIGGAVGDVRSGAPGPAPDGSLYADW